MGFASNLRKFRAKIDWPSTFQKIIQSGSAETSQVMEVGY